jgi:hypothetical protein
VRRPLPLYYEPSYNPTESGVLYWCDEGASQKKNPNDTLPLSELDEIFLGKQTRVFALPEGESIEPRRCISLLGKRSTLNLVAVSKEMVGAWLVGLNSLMQSDGTAVVLNDEDLENAGGVEIEKRRFEVLQNRETAYAPEANDATVENEEDQIFPNEEECIEKMAEGTLFTRFYYNEKTKVPEKTQVFLFYNVDTLDGAPALCWCAPGKRVYNPASSLPVRSLTDIFVGQQKPIFKETVAQGAEYDMCISMSSEKVSLDLQAYSEYEIEGGH